MSDSNSKLGFYVLALAIASGAVAATLYIHFALNNRAGRIDLGDSTHGYLKVQSEKNGIADTGINGSSESTPSSNQLMAGSLSSSLGNFVSN